MERLLTEHAVECPFCAERITLLIDASAGSQEYIEDCEVCCRPMQVAVIVDGDELTGIHVDYAG